MPNAERLVLAWDPRLRCSVGRTVQSQCFSRTPRWDGEFWEGLGFKSTHRITAVKVSSATSKAKSIWEGLAIPYLVIAITSSRKNWSTGNVRPKGKHENKSACHTTHWKGEKDSRWLSFHVGYSVIHWPHSSRLHCVFRHRFCVDKQWVFSKRGLLMCTCTARGRLVHLRQHTYKATCFCCAPCNHLAI